ncbi:site-2 protease family protein [Nocardia camponoti]|uniref:Zinc metalloprotease Rip2 n=1 Tax=Nocardia camponoti TaxID=1616106 RepID=A0A917QIE5_9NOCA|nr:site-2 protease family protein [Nocardia camponoti]GGK52245.1 putative zinc metalloprotease Rip2 [Nocardia camponoti]
MSYSFHKHRSPHHDGVRPSPIFLGIVLVTALGGALAWDADLNSWRAKVGVFILVVGGWIVSLCLHEFAHAYVAWRAGDHEVSARGYLTLNPLKYSHPVLSIALPLVFIALGGIGLPGGAVYLDTSRFKRSVRQLVSAVGPASNALCAIVLLVVIKICGSMHEGAAFWFGLSFLAYLQITATILNALPVPGLDGFGVIEPLLSYQARQTAAQIAPFGMLIVFAVVFYTPLNTVFFSVTDWLFSLSGVPDIWAAYGNYLTRFWK